MVVDKEYNKKQIDEMREKYGIETPYNDVDKLLLNKHSGLSDWYLGSGKIPVHYKRCTIPPNERLKLAELGAIELASFLKGDEKFYFTQCLMAGAIFSGLYHTFFICTQSQYGKSYVMGRIASAYAYKKREEVLIACRSADQSDVIMNEVNNASISAEDEVLNELISLSGGSKISREEKIKKLRQSLSKNRIAYKNGGACQSITLADSYKDNSKSQAMGKGSNYVIDEAAYISEDALMETERRFFSTKGEEAKPKLGIYLSNPHKRGYFYNHLIGPDTPGTCIIWTDILTGIEEENERLENIYRAEWYSNARFRKSYYLCELNENETGMFNTPNIAESEEDVFTSEELSNAKTYFGIDSAYKGKDNIEVCKIISDGRKVFVSELEELDKSNWVVGQTEDEIIREIDTILRYNGATLTCVDYGEGEWFIPALVKKHLRVKGIRFQGKPTPQRVKADHLNAKTAKNLRAEMHLDLMEYLDKGKVYMTSSVYKKIEEFLPDYTFIMNPKIQIRAKKEIKALHSGKSPDGIDAIILGLHAMLLDIMNIH